MGAQHPAQPSVRLRRADDIIGHHGPRGGPEAQHWWKGPWLLLLIRSMFATPASLVLSFVLFRCFSSKIKRQQFLVKNLIAPNQQDQS